jgi:methionyl aminopeptidase
MVIIKSSEEVEKMRQGGKILAEILRKISQEIKNGMPALALDELAEKLIQDSGGIPSFKGYQGSKKEKPFPSALCVSLNSEVVHGPALAEKIIRNGDLIGLDLGMKYLDYFTDMAITIGLGKINREAKKLIRVTRGALELAIGKIKPGIYWQEVAQVIQTQVEKNGFSVVRTLTGHGVGKFVHEDPKLPNFVGNTAFDRMMIEEGMTLAIEPMVNAGYPQVKTLPDGWTVVTTDGKLSAHFEHTIAVTKNGAEILTI